MNYLMHSGYFFIIVIVLFPLIGYFLNKLYFNKYDFDKNYINCFLIFNMFFGSPIGILAAIAFSGIMSLDNRSFNIGIFQDYVIAVVIIIIIGVVKYFIWYIFFRHETNNLLIYSKKFILQIPYLILLFYPWWKLHDMVFALGLVPSMIISEIIILFSIVIISIYQYFKNKNKEK